MPDASLTWFDLVGINTAIKLAWFAVALVAAYFALRFLDRRIDGGRWAAGVAIDGDPVASALYRGLRFAGMVLAVALLLAGCGQARAASIPDAYDAEIEAAVATWWPTGSDARWWKAQLYQESLLVPSAVSPAGARGLAQFMPSTWSEISAELGYGGLSPHLAGPAIDAGAFYMARLWRGWSAPRPVSDRWDLARASYNAGFGNLLAAQRRCGGPPGFSAIMACLPAVTGRNAQETATYVARIHRWYEQLVLCPRC